MRCCSFIASWLWPESKEIMKKVHVFTSAAFNYIPKVRMLFQSLRAHHPEFVLHLALADKLHPEIDLSSEPFDEVMPLDELDIPNVTGWAFCHQIVELATAIKPFALQKLLAREDCEQVLYMDPDTVAFSRLDDVLQSLSNHSVVLTPHLTSPETTIEGVMDNEISCLKHGVYNLGFVGVRSDDEGRRFAKWWGDRIYSFCRDDIKNGLFTDQRWIDLVPAFFENVGILKSPRLNVATWNLRTRLFQGSLEEGFSVDGFPLGFYHFTGFDSGAHRVMADRNAAGNKSVQQLIDWYHAQTSKLSDDPLARVPWAYANYSDGSVVTAAQRIIYRDRIDLQGSFHDPFDASGYLQWWQQQARREYPALFDTHVSESGLQNLTKTLSPGFNPGSSRCSIQLAAITASGTDPVAGRAQPPAPLLLRAWRVFRREGFKGVARRLR